ncbi:MAG TPA: DUF305 domain-containing protein [Candidatus Saccharimonadales bacterium]|nr:DUF305 domain-containing protein [Candidatus Saccharimonadales bacterium]
MKKELLFGVGGLIVGAIVSGFIVAGTNKPETKTNDNSMTMSSMVDSLKGKTGDDFDKAFISGMIEHHQGAIDMANLAKASAKHQEIKSMADDIVSAQSKEIGQMKSWQSEWGYVNSPGSSHGTMNMDH